MIVGHTKFAPDWCFGLFKQRYRRTFVSSLEDVVDVVNSSADVNYAQLVGTQDGEPVVTMYDWATFLSGHFHSVPHMKSYHHFYFSTSHSKEVALQEFSDSCQSLFTMVLDNTWNPDATELPLAIPPLGLSHQRKLYLYHEIREYCRPGTEDLVCPRPATFRERHNVSSEDEGEVATLPQRKRVRRCGKCGGGGHTRRTCKNII